MYIGVISMRYAKALLAYADEKGTEDTVYEEAGILADSFSRIPELRQALDCTAAVSATGCSYVPGR